MVPKHDEERQPRFAHVSTMRRGIGSSRAEPYHQVCTALSRHALSQQLLASCSPDADAVGCRFTSTTPTSKTAVSPGQPILASCQAPFAQGALLHTRCEGGPFHIELHPASAV